MAASLIFCSYFQGIFFHFFNPNVQPTQPPIQWAPGAPVPGAKRQGREANYSPSSGAEVKNGGPIPVLPLTSS
jgi:hypothetical protein